MNMLSDLLYRISALVVAGLMIGITVAGLRYWSRRRESRSISDRDER